MGILNFWEILVFDTVKEYENNLNNAIKNVISGNGKTMRYFYEQISSNNFYTGFDRSFYILKDMPQHEHLIKYDDEYVYARVMGTQDKDLNDFDYKINRYGFRNQKFTKLNPHNYNILVAGCSVTYGMALPESYTWPQILKNKILETKKNINIDNVAVCGIDTFQEIRNIYLYIKKYGKPDFIFMCLPPIYRYPILENPQIRVTTKQDIGWIPDQELLEEYLYENYDKYAMNFFINIITIKNLEQYCNDLEIDLKWISWDNSSQSFYKMLNFKNLIDYKFESKYANNINNEKYWKRARDNAHFGKMHHLEFADLFFDVWSKREHKDKN